jgi:hypothetical protein
MEKIIPKNQLFFISWKELVYLPYFATKEKPLGHIEFVWKFNFNDLPFLYQISIQTKHEFKYFTKIFLHIFIYI